LSGAAVHPAAPLVIQPFFFAFFFSFFIEVPLDIDRAS
jgi:hypothetical protein